METQILEKQLVARHAARMVEPGMIVGLGSGSTAAMAVQFLGDRVRNEGLRFQGVATSPATLTLARQLNIQVVEAWDGGKLDLTIDGADQVTRRGELIKGGGGALLHERIVAAAANRFIVIIDSSKLVDRLGSFPLPVEVFAFGWRNVLTPLQQLGFQPSRREFNQRPVVTEEGNFIIDCEFPASRQFESSLLNMQLREIPGIADHGLFLKLLHTLVIARQGEVEEISFPRQNPC